jgi:hypothetical protein
MPRQPTSLIFDLDGTLVDSVYQHVLAWHQALMDKGIELSIWKIHRRIGMSGGLFARAFSTPPCSRICASVMPPPMAAWRIRCARCRVPSSCSRG